MKFRHRFEGRFNSQKGRESELDVTDIMLRRFPRLLHWLGRLTGANREREMALLDILCDSGRASIDVGAKTGMYSYRLRARSAAVILFEPNPDMAHLLRKVFGAGVTLYEIALSDRKGSAALRLPAAPSGMLKAGRGTIEAANRLTAFGGAAESHRVATRRLDDYALQDVGFIKIDVEGHEMAVLAGAEQTILRCRPNMLVEANNAHAAGAVERLTAWAEAAEYTILFLAGGALHSLHDPGAAEEIAAGEIENFILLPGKSERLVKLIRARLAGAS